jgi:hypothetical protein
MPNKQDILPRYSLNDYKAPSRTTPAATPLGPPLQLTLDASQQEAMRMFRVHVQDQLRSSPGSQADPALMKLLALESERVQKLVPHTPGFTAELGKSLLKPAAIAAAAQAIGAAPPAKPPAEPPADTGDTPHPSAQPNQPEAAPAAKLPAPTVPAQPSAITLPAPSAPAQEATPSKISVQPQEPVVQTLPWLIGQKQELPWAMPGLVPDKKARDRETARTYTGPSEPAATPVSPATGPADQPSATAVGAPAETTDQAQEETAAPVAPSGFWNTVQSLVRPVMQFLGGSETPPTAAAGTASSQDTPDRPTFQTAREGGETEKTVQRVHITGDLALYDKRATLSGTGPAESSPEP